MQRGKTKRDIKVTREAAVAGEKISTRFLGVILVAVNLSNCVQHRRRLSLLPGEMLSLMVLQILRDLVEFNWECKKKQDFFRTTTAGG